MPAKSTFGSASVIPYSSSSSSYKISRSLRFNSADTTYLSKTFASAGTSKTTATISLWVKRARITTANYADAFYESHTSNYNIFGFSGSSVGGNADSLYFIFRFGGSYFSNALYRDPSAWYHVVIVYDSTNATQADRFRFYVNGVRGSFISAPAFALNYEFDGDLGVAGTKFIGNYYASSGYEPNFYLAEYNFVDGQALEPSNFGYIDSITGSWMPKKYAGTYGIQGFYLNFEDNSGNTDTTLGKDSSGNGNNWTPNNFSVTAGSGNDSLLDTPTDYGTDTGLGGEVRGNYATLNPLSVTAGSFVQGNLRYTGPSGWRRANGTIAVSSGKWYWEVTLGNAPFGTGVNQSYNAFGWGLSTAFNSSDSTNTQTSAVALADNQHYKNFSGSATSLGTSFASGDVLGCAVDLDANTFTFYRNGSQLVTGTIGGTAGQALVPIIISYDGSYGVMDCNFGQRPFAPAAPSGFKCLCTANLPTPTIKKPKSAFDAITYNGSGTTFVSPSALAFAPDLVWVKGRSQDISHVLSDTVRGVGEVLCSNNSRLSASDTFLANFNQNGFTLNNSITANNSGSTYVSWNWKAGGPSSTNTNGSITSQVSVDPKAGFSIVSYTGTGANATVGHGLNVSPKFLIVKSRQTSGRSWNVWHTALAGTEYLLLELPDAKATDATKWNSTIPTASVFSLGTASGTNASGEKFIAYCWSEIEGFSKFGSYTGNGSTDGVFVWTGFRPKLVLVKSTTAAEVWVIKDTARSFFNGTDYELYPSSSSIEGAYSAPPIMDYLSNGFKLRSTASASNGATPILFAAFAESPFKYVRAR